MVVLHRLAVVLQPVHCCSVLRSCALCITAHRLLNSHLLLQQDITRGRDMVDSLYQGAQASAGTHNAIMSSQDYLSQV